VDSPAFKVGDLVGWWSGKGWHRRHVFGRVSKVTEKGTVTAKPLTGWEPVVFRHGRGFQHVDPLVEKRIEWLQQRPRTEFVHARFRFGASEDDPPESLEVVQLISPDSAHRAVVELKQLADWWESRPTEAT